MKYTINCGGSRTYATWNYENVKPSCEFTVELTEEELKEQGWFDKVVQTLRGKVENYLNDWDPTTLPF
jgi:hypothetical protein